MNDLVQGILAIVGGVITVAIISVIVSKNAQTPQVLQSAGGALSTVINAAVSPVNGSTGGGNGNNGLGSFTSFGSLISGASNFSNMLNNFGGISI